MAVDLLARRDADARRRTSPVAGSWSRPAAPASTSTRCASSATARRACQGYALARTAAARGAEVTLVAANVGLPDPAGVKVVRVETTAQLQEQVLAASSGADAVVMAAAPADFRPVTESGPKIKKSDDGTAPTIELTENPDILAGLVRDRDAHGTPRSWSVSPPRPATTPARCWSTPGPSSPARAATCWWSTTSAVEPCSAREDNEAVVLAADGERGHRPARLQGGPRPRHLGPGGRAARRCHSSRRRRPVLRPLSARRSRSG